MTDADESDVSDRADSPGKTRTWWHPLLARLLDHVLASAYTVIEEVLVGKMPLRVDILLIRREDGQLSEAGRRDVAPLVPLLNRFTLIEFKGPTDSLEPGDLAQLIGCSFLWHSQQTERVARGDVSLMILAPNINDAFRAEAGLLGCHISEHEPGVFCLVGLPFTTWLVETDIMADRGEPVLSLVSHVFLDDRERIIEELRRKGHTPLLWYMLQQIQQFHNLGEEFAMQHTESEYLGELEEELKTAVLEAIPAEEILSRFTPEEVLSRFTLEEVLSRFTPEEVLSRFTPEDRLRGLPPEDRLRGLTDEELARLREVLEREQSD